MEAVTTLLTVIQKIVKAAETAHQNRARCLDLADRADAIGDSLREDHDPTAGTGGGGAYSAGPQTVRLRMRPLGRLKAALDEALELVESCRRRESGLVARGVAVFTGESMATKLQDVDTRITACLADLGLAEQIAARHREHHRALAEAALAQEPPQQQWPPSLQRLLGKYTPPPVPPPVTQSKQPLPPSLQRFLKQSAPHPPPLPPIKQSTRPLPPSLQRFVKQQAAPPPQQQHNVMQPLPQATNPLLQQRYLARSATPQQHRSFVLPPVPRPQQRAAF